MVMRRFDTTRLPRPDRRLGGSIEIPQSHAAGEHGPARSGVSCSPPQSARRGVSPPCLASRRRAHPRCGVAGITVGGCLPAACAVGPSARPRLERFRPARHDQRQIQFQTRDVETDRVTPESGLFGESWSVCHRAHEVVNARADSHPWGGLSSPMCKSRTRRWRTARPLPIRARHLHVGP